MTSLRTPGAALAALFIGLLTLAGTGARAGEFAVTSVGQAVWQSRDFKRATAVQLLRAGLLVIQDIGFQVTEAEREPGLLVAHSHGPGAPGGGHVLTLSLAPVPGDAGGWRVRLSMAAHRSERELRDYGQPDYGDFYQDFFNHLNRELFRSGSMK